LLAVLAGCQAGPRFEPPALARATGTWSGVRRAAADGSVAPVQLRVESYPGFDGQFRWIEVSADGAPYRGAATQHFDAGAQRWTRLYANRAGRRFARYQAIEIGDRHSVWQSIPRRRGPLSRLRSEHRMDGLWRRAMSVSEDGGRTWRELWVDELRRTR
jgi:hypothetical protein